MKIVKTKEIKPIEISEISDELFMDFRNRSKLHNGKIPDFFVYIQDFAWEAFLSHGHNVYKTLNHEAQGIFLGSYFKDSFGEFIVATKYAEGNGSSTHSYVEMSEECLSDISLKCQKENLLMLIWIHTHPGFGTFYSGTDINCLKTSFYKEYQIGLVVDILKNKVLGYKTSKTGVDEFHDYMIFNDNTNSIYTPFNQKNSLPQKKIGIIGNKKNSDSLIEGLEKKIQDTQNKTIEGIGNINDYLLKIENLLSSLKADLFDNCKLDLLIDRIKSSINQSKYNEEQNTKYNEMYSEILQVCSELKSKPNIITEEEGASQKQSINNNKVLTSLENIESNLSDLTKNYKSFLESSSFLNRRIKINNHIMILVGLLMLVLLLTTTYNLFK